LCLGRYHAADAQGINNILKIGVDKPLDVCYNVYNETVKEKSMFELYVFGVLMVMALVAGFSVRNM
jgi:hypothetical protein|tara:strand:- start:1560 stop:1757 length:198 start_codon:yes stop_codon:yes gene_type:complete